MIGFRVKTIDQTRRVKTAVDRASFRNLGHAAAGIRKFVFGSLKRRKKPSRPGQPPHTRGRAILKRSILFHVDRDRLSSIVGPTHSKVGIVGEAHEFGKKYKGIKYPERPFMGPALAANIDRMPSYWLHSVGR